MIAERPANWVFLGDSLTEGVGSRRATYVTEFAQLLRAANVDHAVHDMRLRDVDPETFNPYIKVNLGGFLDLDSRVAAKSLWLWNLGAEGRTIDTDVRWLPWLENVRPQRIFIHRGSLESIIRPAPFADGQWPASIPASWRGMVSMDPRCYFSDTWWRRAKQATIDAMKQRARLRLLAARPGRPLLDADQLIAHYRVLLNALRPLDAKLLMLGLLPPDAATFPGSAEHFAALNGQLRSLAAEYGAEFVDWGVAFDGVRQRLFYRDGFHPNMAGARRLAEILHAHLLALPS